MKPETLRAWIAATGGRRFLLTVGAGLVNTALLIMGCVSEQTYLTLTLSTVAVYISANTVQKMKGVKNEVV